jgi:hypothetical protein
MTSFEVAKEFAVPGSFAKPGLVGAPPPKMPFIPYDQAATPALIGFPPGLSLYGFATRLS